MTELIVDIQTRIIPADERLFVVFPGKSHKFYADFARESVVFLDLPGLDLAPYATTPEPIILGKLLSKSAKLKSWHLQGRDPASEPERDLAQYPAQAIPKRRAQIAGAARELYFGLRRGELIIVPGPGYFSEVLVGEIADDPEDKTTYQHTKYGNDAMPARKVNWIAKVPKWNLSEELIKRLQLRSPLVLLDRSLRGEIYRLSFPNYVHGDHFSAQFETTKAEFSSRDDLNIQLFLNHVSAILHEIEQDPNGVGIVTLSAALGIVQRAPDFVPELAIEINSPGTLTTISKRITPLVAAALLAVMLHTPAGAAPPKVTVVNSLSPSAACVFDVNEKVQKTIDRLGGAEYREECARLHPTRDRTGLKTRAKVRPGGGQQP